MIRMVFSLALALLLAGCTPDYNWRQVQVADGAITAFFPDKPRSDSRSLTFDGHALDFTLTSVSVQDTLFAVGYAVLPDALRGDEAARRAFAAAVIASLYQNLGKQPPETLPAFGKPFVLEGDAPDGKLRMKTVVWLTEHALVEGIVTAKGGAFPEAQADEFLRGINSRTR